MANNPADIYSHWRDSALTPRFFTIDARAAFFIVIFMMRPNWYTFGVVVFVLAVLSILNYYRVSLIASFRLLRGFLTGSKKIIMRRR
jgi:intracellular multiplication protein IcmT